MKLEHQMRDVKNGFQHRLVDVEDKEAVENHHWMGYRTPVKWTVDNVPEYHSYYIGVTDYFQGSNEFPDPFRIYYVCGVPKHDFELPQYQMMRRIWEMLESYVESIPDFEDPDTSKGMDLAARVEDFLTYAKEVHTMDVHRKATPK